MTTFELPPLTVVVGKPLRVAVYSSIASAIRTGQLSSGDMIANEAALSSQLGVSRSVVREALLLLEEAGLIRTKRGVGRFVADELPAIGLEQLRPTEELLVTPSHPVTVRRAISEIQTASDFIAQGLSLEKDIWAWKSVLMWDGAPVAFSLECTQVAGGPGDGRLSSAVVEQHSSDRSMFGVIVDVLGPVLGPGLCDISVGSAGADRAEALDLDPSTPVLALTQTVYLDGNPLYFAKHVIPPKTGHLAVVQSAQSQTHNDPFSLIPPLRANEDWLRPVTIHSHLQEAHPRMLLNLHTHLEGRLRPDTANELALKLGIPEPTEGWRQSLELDGPSNLTTYLAKIDTSYPFFAVADSLLRIAREAVLDAADDGVEYFELRFGPALHANDRQSLETIIRAVCEGVAQGAFASGIQACVIVAALRHHDTDTNLGVAHAAARFAGRGVVGFDLAGDELRLPALQPHADAFAAAKAAGLGLTCHAAEAAPAEAALQAVELLGVTRIGHGAHLADSPDAMAWIGDCGVLVEVCPTSNLYTGAINTLEDHPVGRFKDAGIAIGLGDDNPRQTRSPISREYELLASTYHFTDSDMRKVTADSINWSFASPSTKQELHSAAARQAAS